MISGVSHKDTRFGPRFKFMGGVWTKPRVTQTAEYTKLTVIRMSVEESKVRTAIVKNLSGHAID